jgi:hypothetical protein
VSPVSGSHFPFQPNRFWLVRGAGFEPETKPSKTEGFGRLTHADTHKIQEIALSWPHLTQPLKDAVIAIIRSHLKSCHVDITKSPSQSFTGKLR